MEELLANQAIRMDVLTRLAELAMTDADFRAIASQDLETALTQYGYELNEHEMAFVSRFRATLEEAGIDLFLAHPPSREQIERLITQSGD